MVTIPQNMVAEILNMVAPISNMVAEIPRMVANPRDLRGGRPQVAERS